jgi:hypothetical protein
MALGKSGGAHFFIMLARRGFGLDTPAVLTCSPADEGNVRAFAVKSGPA